MQLEPLESDAPALAARLAAAEPAVARRFAFRVARLACTVAGVRDEVALEIARGGLARGTDLDDLVRLWELERSLDAACVARFDADAPLPDAATLREQDECAEARAVSAVIAALRPDAHRAAREATHEAIAAGCDAKAVEALADQLL
jgi:hypothetical protein